MENNYIYMPEGRLRDSQSFRCRVPMSGTKQQFLVDGKLEGETGKGYFSGSGEAAYSLSLGKSEVMEDMLQLIMVRNDFSKAELSYTLNMDFQENSSASVLLCSHTITSDQFVTDETIDISMEENASLDLVLMQNESNEARHMSRFHIRMKRNSRLNVSLISLHGGDLQNILRVDLDGEGAECNLNGLYLVDEKQRYGNDIVLRHNVPNCTSNQIFKGILDDYSKAVFSGLVYVALDAQKTAAYQSNHNLLASDHAKIETQPQLEIYADDVKCSHGATVGRLDDQVLFYMRSRGISDKEAKILQQLAFVYEVLEKVSKDELRERLVDLVERRLRGEFTNCRDCSRNCC